MNMRGPCPKPVRATALTIALTLVPMMALPLPAMATGTAMAAEATETATPVPPGQTRQSDQTPRTDAPAVATFRHIPPGPLRGAVGKELAIPVARSGEDEGDYTVQATLASGPRAKGTTEPADISVDGRTVRVVPRQPGTYVIEVRGMREGPVS